MKLVILFSALVLIIGSAFVIIIPREKEILGKWRVDDSSIPAFAQASIESTRKINPEQAEKMEENREAIHEMVSNLVFDYNADSTVELTSANGKQKARWRMVNNSTNLIITRPNGTERKDSILELTTSTFRVLQGERRDTIIYIRP